MKAFQPFTMERMMSRYEQTVEYNLTESGVYPIPLRELLMDHPDSIDLLLDTALNYPHANGNPELRENIAALYPGAGPDNVLVTVGAAEANYNTVRALLSEGDEIVIMLPNYMQIWGVAKNHGLKVATFHLKETSGWAPDVDELNHAVTPGTKLIAVCNPNNPTGYVLSDREMEAIVNAADRVGAWLLADEVYCGTERIRDTRTPSFYGHYDKVIAVNSLSKAYGLPGLRIGWVVGPPDTIDAIWARHEYVTISATMLSNRLAALALSPDVRPRLIDRARIYIRDGFVVLAEWMEAHGETFTLTPHQAGAIAFVRYHLDMNSTVFTERLRSEKSVLLVAGDHFGMDHFVRISFGLPRDILVPALDRVHELVTGIKS